MSDDLKSSSAKRHETRSHIQHLRIDSINPAEYNPRTITPRKMRSLKASLRKFGFVDPIVVNQRSAVGGAIRSKVCVGGHQRLVAWKELGHDTVPSILVELNMDDEMTLNLALNNQAGEWDEFGLAKVLATLERLGVDPAPTGFTDGQLTRALQAVEEAARASDREDQAPALPAKARTKPGELIVLGRHRLLCGDSGEALPRLQAGAAARVPADADAAWDGPLRAVRGASAERHLLHEGGARVDPRLDRARRTGNPCYLGIGEADASRRPETRCGATAGESQSCNRLRAAALAASHCTPRT